MWVRLPQSPNGQKEDRKMSYGLSKAVAIMSPQLKKEIFGRTCLGCKRDIKDGEMCIHRRYKDGEGIEDSVKCLNCIGDNAGLMAEIIAGNGRCYIEGWDECKAGDTWQIESIRKEVSEQ